MGARHYYVEASAEEVPPDTRRAAEHAFATCARHLGLRGPLELCWFRPENAGEREEREERERRGWRAHPGRLLRYEGNWMGDAGSDGRIYVRADLSPGKAAHVVAHEVRHVAQIRWYPRHFEFTHPKGAARRLMEWDSNTYATWACRYLLTRAS